MDALFNSFDRDLEVINSSGPIGYNEVDYKEHDSTLTIEVCTPGFSKAEIQLLNRRKNYKSGSISRWS